VALAANETMRKFGYPASAIAEYRHWSVLLRPQQATLGAIILICRGPETAFSAIGEDAFAELDLVVRDIELTLHRAFAYDKINYLMLMMVDPHVHFHVLPRYAGKQDFGGLSFADPGWPRLPDLAQSTNLDGAMFERLRDHIRVAWAKAPHRALAIGANPA
jgi:diadenosine tetraphosphate (Ap4A) HIT family hydrolase